MYRNGNKLIFESKLHIVEKDQSTLPDDERILYVITPRLKPSDFVLLLTNERRNADNKKSIVVKSILSHVNVEARKFCLNIYVDDFVLLSEI